jgi:hypothetical protein
LKVAVQLVVMGLLFSAGLGGCAAAPNGSWSKDRIQAWADARFPEGMTKQDAERVLRENDKRYEVTAIRSADPNGTRKSHINRVAVYAPIPVFMQPWIRGHPFMHRTAGFVLNFDDDDRLITIEAWSYDTGP